MKEKLSIAGRELQGKQDDELTQIGMWKNHDQAEVQAMNSVKRAQDAARNLVIAENKGRLKLRGLALAEEADYDRQLLANALNREAAEIHAENSEKARQYRDAREYQHHLKAQMERESEDLTALEALCQGEMDRVQQKREDQWQRERDAREALMQEVAVTRAQQIQQKMHLAIIERDEDDRHAQRTISQAVGSIEEERIAAARRQLVRNENQDHVRRQMADNDRRNQQVRQQKLLEDRLLKNTETEYQAKLDDLRSQPAVDQKHFRRSAKWYT